eukprot:615522_1
MDVRTSDTLFEWKITKHFLQKWKNTKMYQSFRSPTFNAIGYKWVLMIYPNGNGIEGIADLTIWCYGLEKGDSVSVCYYTDTIGLDRDVCQIVLDKTMSHDHDMIHCDPPFRFNDIQNQSEINIAIKLWTTESMNKNQLRSIANLYSNEREY